MLLQFDRMLYVVENAQEMHFKNLIEILTKLGHHQWANEIEHVKFGKIRGLSTRKGNAVFLSDILDEAVTIIKEKQEQSPNTRAYDDWTSDVLATTAVVINDLRTKRLKDYEFSWDKALHPDSGVKLQYTHARLSSLLDKMGRSDQDLLDEATDLTMDSLIEDQEALDLIHKLAVFDQILCSAYIDLEPSLVVDYLFTLCKHISVALKVLGVKTAPNEQVAKQRLILFAASRSILAQGMKILGLIPLEKI